MQGDRFSRVLQSFTAAGLTIKLWPEGDYICIRVSKAMEHEGLIDLIESCGISPGDSSSGEPGIYRYERIDMFDHDSDICGIIERLSGEILGIIGGRQRTTREL